MMLWPKNFQFSWLGLDALSLVRPDGVQLFDFCFLNFQFSWLGLDALSLVRPNGVQLLDFCFSNFQFSWLGLDALSLVGPNGVQQLDFCFSSVSVLVLLLSTHFVSSQRILIYMFAVLIQV